MKFFNNSVRLGGVALATVLLTSAFSAPAADLVSYRAKPLGNKVRIDGAANIHEWTMEGTLIGGHFDIPADLILDSAAGDVVGAGDGKVAAMAEVAIPVTSLKNGNWEGMNEVMLDAMKAADFPRIEFKLTELTIKKPHAPNTPIACDSKGLLVIKGTTNAISMPVTIETLEKKRLKISATGIAIKMTDYKIAPPVKAGIFKTEDEVKIKFEWIVGLPQKAAEAK